MANPTGETLSFGLDVTQFTKALDLAAGAAQAFDSKFVASAKRLQDAIDNLTAGFANFAVSTTAIKNAIGSTTELFRASRDAAKAYGVAIGESAKAISDTKSAFTGVNKSLTGLETKLQGSATAFQQVDAGLKSVDLAGFDLRVTALANSLGKLNNPQAIQGLKDLAKAFQAIDQQSGASFKALGAAGRGIERLNTAASNVKIQDIASMFSALGTSLNGISTSKAVTDLTAVRDIIKDIAAVLQQANGALAAFAGAAGAAQLGTIGKQAARAVAAQNNRVLNNTTAVGIPALPPQNTTQVNQVVPRQTTSNQPVLPRNNTTLVNAPAIDLRGRQGGAPQPVLPPGTDKTLRNAVQGVRDLTRATKELSGETKNFGARFLSVYQEIERPVARLRIALLNLRTIFTFLGGSFVFEKLTSSAAEFETAIARVNTLLLEDTRLSVEEYSRNIQRLALTTSKSVVDLTQGVYTALSAGLPSDNTAAGALSVAAEASKLATVGLASQANATEAVVSLLNAYGDANLTAAQAANQLYQTVVVGRTTVDKLGRSFGRVAAVGSRFGVSFNELTAALAEITRVVPSTSEAVTQLRALLLGIGRAGPQVTRRLAELGEQLGKPELATLFSARSLQTKGLFGVLKELNNTIGNSGDLIAKIFPNVRGLVGASVLSSRGLKNFQNSLRRFAVESDPIGRALPRVENTFEERKGRAENRIRNTLDRVGETILPTVASGFEKLALFVEKNEERITRFANAIVKAFFGIADAVKTFIFAVQDNAYIEKFVSALKGLGGLVAGLRDLGEVLSFLLTILLGSKLLKGLGRLGAFLSLTNARAAASAAASAASVAANTQQAAARNSAAFVGAYNKKPLGAPLPGAAGGGLLLNAAGPAGRRGGPIVPPVPGAGPGLFLRTAAANGLAAGIGSKPVDAAVAKAGAALKPKLGAAAFAAGAQAATAFGTGLLKAVSALSFAGLLAVIVSGLVGVIGDAVNAESRKRAEEAIILLEEQQKAADAEAQRRGFVDFQDFQRRVQSIREGEGLVTNAALLRANKDEQVLVPTNLGSGDQGPFVALLKRIAETSGFSGAALQEAAQLQLLRSLDLVTDDFINFRQGLDRLVLDMKNAGVGIEEAVKQTDQVATATLESVDAAAQASQMRDVETIRKLVANADASLVLDSPDALKGLAQELLTAARTTAQIPDVAPVPGTSQLPKAKASISPEAAQLLTALGPALGQAILAVGKESVEREQSDRAALDRAQAAYNEAVTAQKQFNKELSSFDITKIVDFEDSALDPLKQRIDDIVQPIVESGQRIGASLEAVNSELADAQAKLVRRNADIQDQARLALDRGTGDRASARQISDVASIVDNATAEARRTGASGEVLTTALVQKLVAYDPVIFGATDDFVASIAAATKSFSAVNTEIDSLTGRAGKLAQSLEETQKRAERTLLGYLDSLQEIIDENAENERARIAEGIAGAGSTLRVKETEVSVEATLRGLERQIEDKRFALERNLLDIRGKNLELAQKEFELAQARLGLSLDAADAAARERADIQLQIDTELGRRALYAADLRLLSDIAETTNTRSVEDFVQVSEGLFRQAANARNAGAAAANADTPNPGQATESYRQADIYEKAGRIASRVFLETARDEAGDIIPSLTGLVDGLAGNFAEVSLQTFTAELRKLLQNAQAELLASDLKLETLRVDVELKPIIKQAEVLAAVAQLKTQLQQTTLEGRQNLQTAAQRREAARRATRDFQQRGAIALATGVDAATPERRAARDILASGAEDTRLALLAVEQESEAQRLQLAERAAEVDKERTIVAAKLQAGVSDGVRAQLKAELDLLNAKRENLSADELARKEALSQDLTRTEEERAVALEQARAIRTGGDIRGEAAVEAVSALAFGSDILRDAISTGISEGAEGFGDVFKRSGSRFLLGLSSAFGTLTGQLSRLVTQPLDDLGSAFTQPLDNLFGVLGGTLSAIIGFNKPAAAPTLPAVLQDGRFGDLPPYEQQRVLAQVRAQEDARNAREAGTDGPQTAAEAGVQAFEQLFAQAVDAIEAVAEVFPRLFEQFLNKLLARFPDLVNKLAEVLGAGIAVIIKNLPEIIAAVVKGLVGGIGGLFSGLFGGIFHSGGRVTSHMRDAGLAGKLAAAGVGGFQFGGYVGGKNSLSQAVASSISRDDVVALLQPGERVVSNGEQKRLGGPGALEKLLNNGPNPSHGVAVPVPVSGGSGGRIEGFSPQAIDALAAAFRKGLGGSTSRTGRGRGV